MEVRKNKSLYFFIGAVLLVFADQIVKFAVKGFMFCGINHYGMYPGQSIPVIGDILQFTFVENEGMAFGITFGAGKIFLSLFSVIASIVLVWYLNKLKDFSVWIRIGIMFILAGAVGNLVDRVFYGLIYGYAPLFYGRVVDFIIVDIPDVNFWNIHYTHFPVFNVADSCVTIGVIFLLLFHNKIPTLADIKNKNLAVNQTVNLETLPQNESGESDSDIRTE